MSVTESKAKSPAKTSKKAAKPAGAAVVKAVLDAAPVVMAPLSNLVKSRLNARTLPYQAQRVRDLADTIITVGMLQNLVVHALPDGRDGVAAGGCRLAALQLLRDEHRIDDSYLVPVKRVSDDVAAAATLVENEQRAAMHPAEQIAGFRTLSEQGKTPAEIGDLLGYGSRHVQRMLKLAGLAPKLLEKLAADEITVEQCQTLSLESDLTRQLEVYQRVWTEYGQAPAHLLKRAVTDTEISVRSSDFVFIGRDAYEAAGGIVREDLFSAVEGDGTADKILVEHLVQDKLTAIAEDIQATEGWAWSLGRENCIVHYGEDRANFLLLPEPEPQYNEDEQLRLAELEAMLGAAMTYEDEADIQDRIDEIEHQAEVRGWAAEQKAASGVVVSLNNGELCVQRGVQYKAQDRSEGSTVTTGSGIVTLREPDVAEGVSVPLLKKMSSERTLAVQAALLQQPQQAVAMLVWRLCSCTFAYCTKTSHPFRMHLDVHHSSFTSEAPTGKSGTAWQTLLQEKSRLESLLPENWEKDFTTFFALDGQMLMSLMTFCTACSVDGVQERVCGRTSRSPLDSIETAIGFHLRDWWQPTASNFLSMLSKSQIIEALNEAGRTGAASDAQKMKKSDAADLAETMLADTRWVPAWMTAPERNDAEPVPVDAHTEDGQPASAA